jgi:glycosyltransferase involved in cell wall biosynthesis
MRSMHIALFSPSWPPGGQPNGIVTYVDGMRNELQAQGHRVSIVSPAIAPGCADRDIHAVAPNAMQRGLEIVKSKVLGRDLTVFDHGSAIAATFARVHSRAPIDVIEMEESFGFVAEVARTTGLPTVVKLHGPAALTLPAEELETPFGHEKVRREIEALAALPVIIAPSRCTLSETLAHGLKPALAEHVVNPVALAADAPLWSLAECARDTLLFVGRFDAIKGGDLMIAAFHRLLAERPGLRLVFVGPDIGLARADASRLHFDEFVASLGGSALAQRISFRGRLAPAEVASLRTGALVTVVPSRRESQGYTALEAMLQGCPVVCTDTSGLGEIVEHGVTGLKARPDDPADLAAQIKRIVDDAELGQKLGRAARPYVLEHHSPASVVRQTLAVYRRAIELQRRRQP